MNSILYPLKYKIPKWEKLVQDYHEQVKGLDANNSIVDGHSNPTVNDWETICSNYLEKEKSNLTEVTLENWNRLVSNLSDPFSMFFRRLGYVVRKIEDEIKNSHPEFYLLIEEVCRDGKITKAEEKFIIQKAKERSIPDLKVKFLLEENLKVNSTFQVLIDEVCKDGIITKEEYDFLIEKSKDYNISKEVVNKLLHKGILNSKHIKILISNEDFYTLILYYFFIEFYNPQSIYIFSILDFGKMLVLNPERIDTLAPFMKKLHSELAMELKKKFEGLEQVFLEKDIHSFLTELDINILTIEKAKNKLENGSIEKDKEIEKSISIYDRKYYFEFFKSKGKPLFYHKFKDNKDIIYLNKAHKLIKRRKGKDIDILKIICTALYCSKFDLYDNKIDVFINKFSHYIDQILEVE